MNMFLRSVSVNRWSSGRLWSLAITSKQQQPSIRCLHQHCAHRSPLLLLQSKYQRVLFSQVRTINIAGEDSLEKARRPNWQQKTNGDQQQQQQERSSKRRTPLAYMFAVSSRIYLRPLVTNVFFPAPSSSHLLPGNMANLPTAVEAGADRQAGAPGQESAGGVSRKVPTITLSMFSSLLTPMLSSIV